MAANALRKEQGRDKKNYELITLLDEFTRMKKDYIQELKSQGQRDTDKRGQSVSQIDRDRA